MQQLPSRASDAGPEYSQLTECVRCGQEMSWATSEYCYSCAEDVRREELAALAAPHSSLYELEQARIGREKWAEYQKTRDAKFFAEIDEIIATKKDGGAR